MSTNYVLQKCKMHVICIFFVLWHENEYKKNVTFLLLFLVGHLDVLLVVP